MLPYTKSVFNPVINCRSNFKNPVMNCFPPIPYPPSPIPHPLSPIPHPFSPILFKQDLVLPRL
ncbi:MAG: hypothetical protein EWV81_16955 [Microcystis aeruginosa Ma_SC_T_19800800_S464]|uniref:Uncharacterized protein n=1 Tax=Microcystis aeruginosa Ma_SC_T_19800800_S464 TaxID=2486257 RepID=A0A552DLJ5_MICAE|nr:MAG: hypothetical protein EWV81_16955 [Microcystis aeruginosa Ma_SC_T_19800800_S464]